VGARLEPSSGLSGECIRTGKMIHCRDTQSDERVDPAVCRELDLRSLVILPLFHHDKVSGVLEVFSPETDSFSDSDLRLLLQAGSLTMKLAYDPGKAAVVETPAKRVLTTEPVRTEAKANPILEKKKPEEPKAKVPVVKPSVEPVVEKKQPAEEVAAETSH